MLVLANLVSREGENTVDSEGYVDGLAEDESGDLIEAGLVVVPEGGGVDDCKMEYSLYMWVCAM